MEILINFIEKRPGMAKNYIPKTQQGRNMNDLGRKLNTTGLPNKAVVSWRKVGLDRLNTKKKCSQNLLFIKKNGGGPSEEVPMTDLEEKTIQVTVTGSSSNSFGAPQIAVRGESDGPKILLLGPKAVQEENVFLKRRISHIDASAPKRIRSTGKEYASKMDLFKKQMDADAKFQERLLLLMSERNEEEARYHCQVVRILQESNEIAAKRLRKDS